MAPATKDVIEAIDTKIAETRREQERLRRAAELLPTVEANLTALLRSRAILSGEEPEETEAISSLGQHRSTARSGSIGAMAVEILREAGKPLHVNDLAARLRAKGSKAAKHTVVGSLARYTKIGRLRRTAPSTYALAS